MKPIMGRPGRKNISRRKPHPLARIRLPRGRPRAHAAGQTQRTEQSYFGNE